MLAGGVEADDEQRMPPACKQHSLQRQLVGCELSVQTPSHCIAPRAAAQPAGPKHADRWAGPAQQHTAVLTLVCVDPGCAPALWHHLNGGVERMAGKGVWKGGWEAGYLAAAARLRAKTSVKADGQPCTAAQHEACWPPGCNGVQDPTSMPASLAAGTYQQRTQWQPPCSRTFPCPSAHPGLRSDLNQWGRLAAGGHGTPSKLRTAGSCSSEQRVCKDAQQRSSTCRSTTAGCHCRQCTRECQPTCLQPMQLAGEEAQQVVAAAH